MFTVSRAYINSRLLRCLAPFQRSICSGRFPQLTSQEKIQNGSSEEPVKSGYGEKEIFLLGPMDIRTPLPGNMGIPPLSLLCTDTISQLPKPSGEKCEVTSSLLPEERYETYLTQAACIATEKSLASSQSLECSGYDCPELLKKDFSELFPFRNVKTGDLTVITLCQKTRNDMSEWSENAEMERETLESCFVTAASAICTQLSYYNYWADFIHPNSGKPNYEPLTLASMFETDARYRHFGFSIEDLGCCTIIKHKDWGTHVFIGAVFTNAPLHSREVQNILARHRL